MKKKSFMWLTPVRQENWLLTSRPNLPGTNSIFNQYFFFSLSVFPLFSLSTSDRWIQIIKLILLANFSLNCAPAACLYQHSILFLFLRFSLCASDSWSQTLKLKITGKLFYQLRFCCLLYSINIFFFFSLSVSFLYFFLVQVTAGVKPSNLRSWDNCFINWASVACQILSIFFLLFFSFCSASDRWSQTLKLKIMGKLFYRLHFWCLSYSTLNTFFSFCYFLFVQVTVGVELSNLRSWANCSIACAFAACHIQSIFFSFLSLSFCYLLLVQVTAGVKLSNLKS